MVLGQPVSDATMVGGNFDFNLRFSSMDQPDSDQPSIFIALEDQYGLKLVPAKVEVQSLMVDHADLIPAEN